MSIYQWLRMWRIYHYIQHGADELRDPGPVFSTSRYLAEYPAVRNAPINPLLHYLRHGALETRR